MDSAQKDVPESKRISRKQLSDVVAAIPGDELWRPCIYQELELARIEYALEELRKTFFARHGDESLGDSTEASQASRRIRILPKHTPVAEIEKMLREDPAWRDLTEERKKIEQQIRSVLVEEVLVPRLFVALNEHESKQSDTLARYKAPLDPDETTRLYSLADENTRVFNRAQKELEKITTRAPHAAIGVAGPRGCGKSTLVEGFVNLFDKGRFPLRLVQPAPIHYVPKEFLLHLYGKICENILGAGHEGDQSGRRARKSPAVVVLVASVVATLSGLGFIIAFTASPPSPSSAATTALGGAILTLVACWVVMLATEQRARRPVRISKDEALRFTGWQRGWQRSNPYSSLAWIWSIHPRREPKFDGLIYSAVLVGAAYLVSAQGWVSWITPRRAAGIALVGTAVLTLWRGERRCFAKSLGISEAEAWERIQLVIRQRSLAAASNAAQFVAVFGGAALVFLPKRVASPDARLMTGTILCAAGAAALAMSLRSMQILSEIAKRSEDALASPVARTLQRIRYQRSVTAGWSSSLKAGGGSWAPLGAEATASGAITDRETPLNTPDIVEGIKHLLDKHGPALIGIDELDKLETLDEARDFLNEIKGILQADNTHFFVSMSEDAIASFERRGMPFRDVFDSAFDEIIRVPYLSFVESQDLLCKRVWPIPPPFVGLAHCLSGGLARDLIRVTARMVDIAETPERGTLENVARQIVHEEVSGKTYATCAAIKQLYLEPEVSSLLTAIQHLDVCEHGMPNNSGCRLLQPHWLLPLQQATPEVATAENSEKIPTLRTLLRLGSELATFYYYNRTLLEYFRFEGDEIPCMKTIEEEGGRELNALARARQDFSLNPHVAWEEVTLFRAEAGLESFQPPLPRL